MESRTGESLIKLLDDPDQVIYEAVSLKIQQIGTELIPDLESAAQQALSPLLHERLESIIKILHFNQLKNDLTDWIQSPCPELLEGAWLFCRYQFPDLTRKQFMGLIIPLRSEIWLEVSDSLTAMEKVRVMNSLLFSNNRVVLNESHPDSPGNNFINRILETGQGNEYSLNLLYAILAQELSIPLFVAEMPDYPILAYVDMLMVPNGDLNPELYDVLFYVNPADKGTMHSKIDLTNYLFRQSYPIEQSYYQPRRNSEFIRICFQKLELDYQVAGSQKRSSQVLDLIKLWK